MGGIVLTHVQACKGGRIARVQIAAVHQMLHHHRLDMVVLVHWRISAHANNVAESRLETAPARTPAGRAVHTARDSAPMNAMPPPHII